MCKLHFSIQPDNLTDPQVLRLIDEHLQQMAEQSPPESMHGLDASKLRAPDVRFWAAWSSAGDLAGIGALKSLDHEQAEIKSMRTARRYLRCGVASSLLEHLITEARQLGVKRLYLETGSMPEFAAARTLYEKFGFKYCKPFANYIEDHNSVFMRHTLSE